MSFLTNDSSTMTLSGLLPTLSPDEIRELAAACPTDHHRQRLHQWVKQSLSRTMVLTAPTTATPDIAPTDRFEFRGAAAELQGDRSPELVMSGPAGTGKSLACLWKLHHACARVPNVRALIVRKTRASLTESALVTFERDVLPSGCGLGLGAGRANRHSYRYPNGSEIVCGGLGDADQIRKVMSTEYDLIFVQEGIELNENDWESLSTRLRSNRLPYQQLLADTNPDSPNHWLKRRCNAGKTKLLESRHEDNPSLWDVATGDWTAFGKIYLERLDGLSGSRKQRLRFGKWVQAEGVVYDGWNPAIHVVDPKPISREWPRYWSVDFGFTNPFTCQFWAVDGDGRLHMYREIYMTGRLVEDHARQLLDICGVVGGRWDLAREPKPRAIICDHDAEDRATLTRHLGTGTTPARKEVSPGIQAVAARLRKAGDGKPRLVVHRDCLVERDRALDAARKPCSLVEEMDGYVWDLDGGRKQGEVPLKKNDHGADSLRYMCFWLDGGGRVEYRQTNTPATTWVDEGPGIWSA